MDGTRARAEVDTDACRCECECELLLPQRAGPPSGPTLSTQAEDRTECQRCPRGALGRCLLVAVVGAGESP